MIARLTHRTQRLASGAAAVTILIGLTSASAIGAPLPMHLVVIRSVPPLPGVRFFWNGTVITADGQGVARIRVRLNGTYRLSAQQSYQRGAVQANFARWADEYRNTRSVVIHSHVFEKDLAAGFWVSYRVRVAFDSTAGQPVDPNEVEQYTLYSTVGTALTATDLNPKWLLAARVVRLQSGQLIAKPIEWSVNSVEVAGSSVVQRGSQRLLPAPDRVWRIHLLFYSVRILVRDALFGFPTGSSLTLVFPNGQSKLYGIGDGGTVVIPALPRGDYVVRVHGSGLSLTQPMSLSRHQVETLRVVSYLDLALIGAVFILFLVAMPVLARRLALRRRLLVGQPAVGSPQPVPAPTASNVSLKFAKASLGSAIVEMFEVARRGSVHFVQTINSHPERLERAAHNIGPLVRNWISAVTAVLSRSWRSVTSFLRRPSVLLVVVLIIAALILALLMDGSHQRSDHPSTSMTHPQPQITSGFASGRLVSTSISS